MSAKSEGVLTIALTDSPCNWKSNDGDDDAKRKIEGEWTDWEDRAVGVHSETEGG